MDIRQVIADHLSTILVEEGRSLAAPLADDTPLLQTGLDSLGYAVLVVRLEDALGYDPFVLMADPVYPRTFGEFAGCYEAYRDHAAFA
jgi:acyl carrier protein